MKRLNIICPKNVWPKSFSGTAALGVLEARPKEPATLWIVFNVTNGRVESVVGMLSKGGEVPAEVQKLSPVMTARARKKIWMLLFDDKESFFQALAKGDVFIGGDFRVFGRYTPALVRLVEGTNLWTCFDDVLVELKGKEI